MSLSVDSPKPSIIRFEGFNPTAGSFTAFNAISLTIFHTYIYHIPNLFVFAARLHPLGLHWFNHLLRGTNAPAPILYSTFSCCLRRCAAISYGHVWFCDDCYGCPFLGFHFGADLHIYLFSHLSVCLETERGMGGLSQADMMRIAFCFFFSGPQKLSPRRRDQVKVKYWKSAELALWYANIEEYTARCDVFLHGLLCGWKVGGQTYTVCLPREPWNNGLYIHTHSFQHQYRNLSGFYAIQTQALGMYMCSTLSTVEFAKK